MNFMEIARNRQSCRAYDTTRPVEPEKLQAIAVIVRQGMSVARTEQYVESLLSREEAGKARVNVGAFLSYLNQSLARIQLSGIGAVSERRETDSQIVLTITIPKTEKGAF